MIEAGPLSLLPAFAAIALCLVTRRVLLSLVSSIWLAGFLVVLAEDPFWLAPFTGAYHVVTVIMWEALSDSFHFQILLFTFFVAAMVGVMSASGGTRAMVGLLETRAKTRRGGMLATWFAGLTVFFDDYANCLVVGSAMRPLADRLRISREKLAYIIDSTAAPIASLALISTWIGYEILLLNEGLEAAGIEKDAYIFFVEGLGYRFYSLYTIVFVGAIAWTGKDFGPMVAAEEAALARPVEEAEEASEAVQPALALAAILPIVTLLATALFMMWHTGREGLEPDAPLFEVLGNADSAKAMFQASAISLGLSVVLARVLGGLGGVESVKAGLGSMRHLSLALVVLFCAWTLGGAISELGAAEYVTSLLASTLPAWTLPTLVFVLAALTSFATGSSFTAMAILIPMALPLGFAISADPAIHLATAGSVLTGACWGDHCSPISDTTVLSSIGSGCELVPHVRTQLPYAVVTGMLSLVAGTIPVGLGVPVWLTLIVGGTASVAAVVFLGRVPGSTQDVGSALSSPS
ncbi:MAG: Na+/H+ antiporter NhaC family protein [Myxococcota bacterium]|nr:Na+/H+ antiporter NhaC family protein [Myxococcota bacterium]